MDGYSFFYFIAAASATFAVWNVVLLFRSKPAPEEITGAAHFGDEQRVVAQRYREFRQKLHDFSQKVDLVEEHSGEYAMALAECGWSEVVATYGALERVNNYLGTLAQGNNWSNIKELLSWLLDDRPEQSLPEELLRLLRADAPLLRNWEEQISKGIEGAVVALGQSAQKTKSLGIQRARKRNPTLVAVEKLFTMIRSEEPPVSN